VEVAVTLPLVLTVLIGLWEVGRLVEVTQIVSNAAREAGRQASAGKKTAAEVRADAISYLQFAGIPTQAASVTVTNLDNGSSSEPSAATQLDRFRITVSIPFDSIRWILMNKVTNATTITATSQWYSMRDVPVTISNAIPID
jgi:Flp pilus assembly protein TadG